MGDLIREPMPENTTAGPVIDLGAIPNQPHDDGSCIAPKQASHASTESPNGAILLRDREGKPRPQATILTEIGMRHGLFHDVGGDPYAKVEVGGHVEVHPVGSAGYRDILSHAYYRLSGKGCNRNAVGDALATISATAKFDRPAEPVFLRVARTCDGVVIDSGDADWTQYHVTAAGWQVAKTRIVNFRRPSKTLALPVPQRPGDASRLWCLVNVPEQSRPLIAGWLVAALGLDAPVAALALSGEQGTAKSTLTKALRRLTDPCEVPLLAPPRDEEALLVAGMASRVLAIDNLSGLAPWLSDALCRLVTGGSFHRRKLYTDGELMAVSLRLALILNGIDDIATRPDLAERCVHLELEPIKERVTEADFWRKFDADAGHIFAAILDGISMALRDSGTVKIERLPRMADFAQWAAASMPAFGFTADEFLKTYQTNADSGVELGLESSLVGRATVEFIAKRQKWSGSTSGLLGHLAEIVGEQGTRSLSWPRSPRGLVQSLRRLGPALRHVGVVVTQERNREERSIALCITPKQASQPSRSPASQTSGDACDSCDACLPDMHGTSSEETLPIPAEFDDLAREVL